MYIVFRIWIMYAEGLSLFVNVAHMMRQYLKIQIST